MSEEKKKSYTHGYIKIDGVYTWVGVTKLKTEIKELQTQVGDLLNDYNAAQNEIKELQAQVVAAEAPIGQPEPALVTNQKDSIERPFRDRIALLRKRNTKLHDDRSAARKKIKELESKIWELEIQYVGDLLNNNAAQSEERRRHESDCRIITLEDRIKELQATVQAAEARIELLISIKSKFLGERDTAYKQIRELQTEVADYYQTIRSKGDEVAVLSSMNARQVEIIQGMRKEIKGLIADCTTDEIGCGILLGGFRKKVKQLQEENEVLVLRNNALASACNTRVPAPQLVAHAGLQSENVQLKERNHALVVRIENLKVIIRDTLRTVKGVSFLTVRQLIKQLESVL